MHRPWSDVALCGVWTGFAHFPLIQQVFRHNLIKWICSNWGIRSYSVWIRKINTVFMEYFYSETFLYRHLDTTTKFVIMINGLARNFRTRGDSQKLWNHIVLNSPKTCVFGYLWCDSNKYPKHMFYEKMRIKQGISCISFCLWRILYSSRFILMAISLGVSAVVVTKVHCTWYVRPGCTVNLLYTDTRYNDKVR